jgi:hypothetical protein
MEIEAMDESHEVGSRLEKEATSPQLDSLDISLNTTTEDIDDLDTSDDFASSLDKNLSISDRPSGRRTYGKAKAHSISNSNEAEDLSPKTRTTAALYDIGEIESESDEKEEKAPDSPDQPSDEDEYVVEFTKDAPDENPIDEESPIDFGSDDEDTVDMGGDKDEAPTNTIKVFNTVQTEEEKPIEFGSDGSDNEDDVNENINAGGEKDLGGVLSDLENDKELDWLHAELSQKEPSNDLLESPESQRSQGGEKKSPKPARKGDDSDYSDGEEREDRKSVV